MKRPSIRGDLDAAKAPAQWIADYQETTGLPQGSAVYVKTMKDAAKSVATAADIQAAASGAATLVGTCGNCHSAANVKTRMPAPTLATGKDGKAAHMAEHQFAVDLMYRGLVGPSDEDWTKGASELAGAPLGGKALPEAKDSLAAEKKVHEVADAAAKATDRSGRGHGVRRSDRQLRELPRPARPRLGTRAAEGRVGTAVPAAWPPLCARCGVRGACRCSAHGARCTMRGVRCPVRGGRGVRP